MRKNGEFDLVTPFTKLAHITSQQAFYTCKRRFTYPSQFYPVGALQVGFPLSRSFVFFTTRLSDFTKNDCVSFNI